MTVSAQPLLKCHLHAEKHSFGFCRAPDAWQFFSLLHSFLFYRKAFFPLHLVKRVLPSPYSELQPFLSCQLLTFTLGSFTWDIHLIEMTGQFSLVSLTWSEQSEPRAQPSEHRQASHGEGRARRALQARALLGPFIALDLFCTEQELLRDLHNGKQEMPGSSECPCHLSCPSLVPEFSATVEVFTC